MRAALYWVPGLDDPLYQAGVAWLGRDAETGAAVAQPCTPGIADITADARRYGLHATLRPPMRLAASYDAFRGAARTMAAQCRAFALPALEFAEIGGFLALRESAPCPALRELADRCLLATDPHRLPPGAAELARRRGAGLSKRQDGYLERYGYPYVLAEWFFHITLTRRLDAPEMARIRAVAETHFGRALAAPRMIRDVAICTQGTGDFLIAERLSLGR